MRRRSRQRNRLANCGGYRQQHLSGSRKPWLSLLRRQQEGVILGELTRFLTRLRRSRIWISKRDDSLTIIVNPIEEHCFADLRFRNDGKRLLIQTTTFLGTTPKPTGHKAFERLLGRHNVDPMVSFVHHYSSQGAVGTGRLQYAQVDRSEIFVVTPVKLDSIAGSNLLYLV